MARLDRIVYRSNFASIVEVLTYGSEEIRLPAYSIAFIRSGYFSMHPAHPSLIADANYAVFGGECECLRSDACKHICACTIVGCSTQALRTARAACALVSPQAFLLQAKMLRDARVRTVHGEPPIFDLLRETCSSNVFSPYSNSSIVTEIRRRLNESPDRRLALPAIAGEFYMSPFTVSRLFHKETGLRLRHYFSRLRLRRALNLLMQTHKTLTNIAIDLGFYDESHFSKAFRSEFGVSPQSVRKY